MNDLLKVFIGLLACCMSCQRPMADTATASPDRATNIILLIGDGMGLTQLSTAYYYGAGTPNFSRFRHIGLHQNQPVGAKITDSAAGATAFSAGIKSYNGAIGVDQDTIPQQTILEWAALAGKRTGVVATSTITHATPASFYAHVFSRNEHEAIALDFLDATVDFAAGGGSKYFGTNRSDGRDILGELEQIGYAVDTTTLPDMAHQNKKHAYLIATDALPKMSEGRGEFLSQATNLALDYLSKDPDGFFLMVEGSQIDWGGHDNDADYVIQEVLDFDQSVGVALDFAERDGNTLVIVTADHETGGLSLSAPEVFGRGDYRGISPTFSTGGHSAALVPVLAYGPGAELFTGIYQNSDIYHKMMRVFGADQMLSSNP